MPRRRIRRRPVQHRRRRRGGLRTAALPGLLSRALGYLREHKLVSRGASALGYGRRRKRRVGRRRVVRRRRGRGVLSSLLGLTGLGRRRKRVTRRKRGRGLLSSLLGMTGLGRRRRRVHRTRRRRRGRGIEDFFRDVGRTVLDRVKKPSSWLGAASMIPGPWSVPARIGATVAGLAGHGRRRRRYGGHRMGRMGMGLFSMPQPL